jgi:threonine dehydratase
MPENAPAVKRRAVEGYGAEITTCPATLEARETTAAAVAERTGATFLHPYDQAPVIAGQGTVALELVEQVADLDAVLVPVGGGGLISGIALALRELAPAVRIYGAEPAGADDAARSREAGRLIPQTRPNTIADGLLTSLGDLTWPVVRDLVHDIVVVDDEAIVAAMRLIWERMKIIVEPSAATVLAAALHSSSSSSFRGRRVGLVLSGGNVDVSQLPW